MVPWRISLALNAKNNYNDAEWNSGADPSRLTKAQIVSLLAKHDPANHGAYHGLDGNYHAASIADNVAQQQAYLLAQYGRLARVGVVPNSDQGYAQAFRDAGLLAGTSQGSQQGIDFQGDSYYRPRSLESYPAGYVQQYRDFNDENDAAQASIDLLVNRVQMVLDDANAGAHPVEIFGMHNCVASQVMQALTTIKNNAADRLLVTSYQRLMEYRDARAGVVVSTSVSGNVLTVKLDYGNVSAKNRYDNLSLKLSGTSATLQSVTQSGADGVSFNPTTGLVNVQKTRTITSLDGLARTAGGGGDTVPTTPPADAGTTPTGAIEGVIPYDAGRWGYQTGTFGHAALKRFFNGVTDQDAIPPAQQSLTPTNDVYFSFPPQHYLDKVEGYDGSGTAASNGTTPLSIYVKPVGQPEFLVGTFTGSDFGKWVSLSQQLTQRVQVEYVRVHSAEANALWFTQLRFTGAYVPYTQKFPRTYGKFLRQIRTNTFWYNILRNTDVYGGVVPEWFAQLKTFTGGRYYVKADKIWTPEGTLRFGPSMDGGANYDTILGAWQDAGTDALLALCGNFVQNKNTYPSPTSDLADNAPWAYGADLTDPESFRLWAVEVFQVVARVGSKVVPASLLKAATTPYAPSDPTHEAKTGLNLTTRLQILNEAAKTWMGLAAFMGPKVAALFWSVVLDGHKNTMGPGVGALNADPDFELIFGWLFDADAGAILAFYHELGLLRGYNADGTVNGAPKVFDVHTYSRRPTGQGTPFSQSGLPTQFDEVFDVLARVAPGTKLIKTEWGYAGRAKAAGNDETGAYLAAGFSYLEAAAGLTAEQRRGANVLAEALTAAGDGVDEGFLYDDRNHLNDEQIDAISGGINWDLLCGVLDTITAFYLLQAKAILGERFVVEDVRTGGLFYQRHGLAGLGDVHVVWGSGTYTLKLSGAHTVTTYAFSDAGAVATATPQAVTGNYQVVASEMPFFFTVASTAVGAPGAAPVIGEPMPLPTGASITGGVLTVPGVDPSAYLVVLQLKAGAAAQAIGVTSDYPFAEPGEAGAPVDAYTKAQADALDAAVAAAAASATNVQKQRIDALLAGADGSVDTFIEAYNRFVADETAAAALNGQVASIASAVGPVANLLTGAKNSLVEAVNELWNGKTSPGLGLIKSGNTLGLATSASKQALPTGTLNTSVNTTTGALYASSGNTASPLIGINPLVPLTITPYVSVGAWYDANGVFIAPPGNQFTPSNIPSTAAYMRLAYAAKDYPNVTYSLASLPYVASVNGTRPDAYGNVTLNVGGGGGGAYAPIDSPTFTTSVTLPAVNADDNSLKAAPTSYVQNLFTQFLGQYNLVKLNSAAYYTSFYSGKLLGYASVLASVQALDSETVGQDGNNTDAFTILYLNQPGNLSGLASTPSTRFYLKSATPDPLNVTLGSAGLRIYGAVRVNFSGAAVSVLPNGTQVLRDGSASSLQFLPGSATTLTLSNFVVSAWANPGGINTPCTVTLQGSTSVPPTTPAGITLIDQRSTGSGVMPAQLEAVRTTLVATAAQSGSYNLVPTDAGNVVPINSGSASTVTIPDDSTAFVVGTVIEVSQEGGGQVSIAAAGGVSVTGFGGLKTAGQYAAVGLRKTGANAWRVTGGVA